MRILHLLYESKGDPFGFGGVGIRAYEIYSHLKDRHDITLLCRRYPGVRDGEIEGLRHIFVGTESRSFTKTLLSYAYYSSLFVRRHGEAFDIIVQEFSPAVPSPLHLFTKKPLVLQIQGHTGIRYFQKYNFLYAAVLYTFERFLPRSYRNLLLVSENSRNDYRIHSRRYENVEIISNGISNELFESEETEEADYILFLGRIDIHHKGLDTLLTAYKDFYRIFPGIRLVIAGDGRDMKPFSDRLEMLPADARENIEIKGWVDGERKAALLRKAALVVMPSRYEAQSIVSLEAMAHGKALLVSDIPALAYVTEGRAGVSFKMGDADSLSKAMTRCFKMSRTERTEIGRNGRELVRDFTWDKVALRYEDLLYRIAGTGLSEGRANRTYRPPERQL